LVALATVTLDVMVGFGFERRHQHAPRSLARDLVQQN
jgi:hypothetical protein